MKSTYRHLPAVVAALALLVACPATADILTYTAILNGGNEVPPNASTATGMAVLTMDTEAGSYVLPLYLEFTGLSSAQTGAFVYQGSAGGNGAVTYTLPLGSPLDTFFELDGLFELPLLANEGLYVNIHTENYPDGEIRGQLVLTSTVADRNTAWGSIKSLFR